MAAERPLGDRKRKKMAKRKKDKSSEISVAQVAEKEGETYNATMEHMKSTKKRKSSADSGIKTKATVSGGFNSSDEKQRPRVGNDNAKKLRNKRERSAKSSESGNDVRDTSISDGVEEIASDRKRVTDEPGPSKLLRKGKKKGRRDKHVTAFECESEQPYAEPEAPTINLERREDNNTRRSSKPGKLKKSGKTEKKNLSPVTEISQDSLLEKSETAEDEVYEMSSGDEDNSKGMKKWITQYYQSRPGLKVLEERIDDFMTAHVAQEAKARAEREAKAAEGGWTVVVHQKGRKKTSDAESGVVVGSVTKAAILENIAQKKKKDVGLDFYRFQKREAHRNEIMMLQSKFEQDKKRIQEMRAARKFRPY